DPDALIAAQADGQYVVDALTPIDDFNERFGADFDDDEYDTIGGLVTAAIGHLPEAGEELTLGRFGFRVARADARRLHALHVTVLGNTECACAPLPAAAGAPGCGLDRRGDAARRASAIRGLGPGLPHDGRAGGPAGAVPAAGSACPGRAARRRGDHAAGRDLLRALRPQRDRRRRSGLARAGVVQLRLLRHGGAGLHRPLRARRHALPAGR